MMPRKIWIWSVALAAARFLIFLAIYANQSHDAQWQLSYIPLWIIDFPISIAYFAISLPIPLAEGIIGPIWWFIVPIIFWLLFRKRKGHQKK
jgi:hypothetical protein